MPENSLPSAPTDANTESIEDQSLRLREFIDGRKYASAGINSRNEVQVSVCVPMALWIAESGVKSMRSMTWLFVRALWHFMGGKGADRG